MTHIATQCIASRIVEHYDIVEFHLPQALHTTIVPMGPFDITLTLEKRKRMLCQRHRQWCLWDARTIAYLRYEEVVARQQRLLQRTRWDHIVLEEEQVDEIHGNQGKYQCIDP